MAAIKRIRLDACDDPKELDELKQRFIREAQVAAQLQHPNIVTVYDIVSTPDMTCIVMELLDGTSLASVLASKKRLDLPKAIDILSQVAEALDYAHQQKVVQRRHATQSTRDSGRALSGTSRGKRQLLAKRPLGRLCPGLQLVQDQSRGFGDGLPAGEVLGRGTRAEGCGGNESRSGRGSLRATRDPSDHPASSPTMAPVFGPYT